MTMPRRNFFLREQARRLRKGVMVVRKIKEIIKVTDNENARKVNEHRKLDENRSGIHAGGLRELKRQ